MTRYNMIWQDTTWYEKIQHDITRYNMIQHTSFFCLFKSLFYIYPETKIQEDIKNTMWYNFVIHWDTKWYNEIQCHTSRHNVIQHVTTWYNIIQQGTTWYNTHHTTFSCLCTSLSYIYPVTRVSVRWIKLIKANYVAAYLPKIIWWVLITTKHV